MWNAGDCPSHAITSYQIKLPYDNSNGYRLVGIVMYTIKSEKIKFKPGKLDSLFPISAHLYQNTAASTSIIVLPM